MKETIKESNRRFVDVLEEDYKDNNPKNTLLAPRLAQIYLAGKRVDKDIRRAIEILSASSLAESKYLLLKLSIENKNYADAYHFSKFLQVSK